MDTDEATRIRQGASASTSPDVLQALARDPSVTVRASLALNPALPEPVVAMLVADSDARVRAIISRKIGVLTPAMSIDTRERVQENAVANLTAMVADAALRVRMNIAEAVRDMPDGPREIILRLAHDPAIMVCEPVLRFSPMLTQEDLVALITSGPPPSTLMIVAKRAKIGVEVSDAIVEAADTAAIGALLSNHTAQIRETTLDALAAQSEEQTSWQEPLVRRPHLPQRAQRMLAEIVTGHLLETLAARSDLDPKLGQALHSALNGIRRVAPQVQAGGPWAAAAVSQGGKARTVDSPSQAPRPAMQQAGRPDDYAILDALRGKAPASASSMLAARAGVSLQVVERACSLRSAKAIVTLAWKAGLSAQTAVVLQAMLAHIAPDQVLRPSQDGGFALSNDEMQWQLGFLGVDNGLSRSGVGTGSSQSSVGTGSSQSGVGMGSSQSGADNRLPRANVDKGPSRAWTPRRLSS